MTAQFTFKFITPLSSTHIATELARDAAPCRYTIGRAQRVGGFDLDDVHGNPQG